MERQAPTPALYPLKMVWPLSVTLALPHIPFPYQAPEPTTSPSASAIPSGIKTASMFRLTATRRIYGKQALVAILEKHLLDDARQQHFTICRDAHHRDIRRCKRRTVLRLPCLQQLFGGSLCRQRDLYTLSTPLYRRGRQRVSAG